MFASVLQDYSLTDLNFVNPGADAICQSYYRAKSGFPVDQSLTPNLR